jgi:putative transposase
MNYERMVLFRVLQLRRRQRYVGGRKLQKMLADPAYGLPLNIGRDSLFKLLKKYHQLSELKKKYRCTTAGKPCFSVHPNLLQGLEVNRVNQVWVSDITYLRLSQGRFCYLFLVSDYFSRKILGFALQASLSATGALDALKAAYQSARPPVGVIHHSDHGIQYCCKEYTDLLAQLEIRTSMTSDHHCYDNAVAERINGILKQEFGLGNRLPGIEAARKLLTDGIKLYNAERLHCSLGYKTPNYVFDLCKASTNEVETTINRKIVNL